MKEEFYMRHNLKKSGEGPGGKFAGPSIKYTLSLGLERPRVYPSNLFHNRAVYQLFGKYKKFLLSVQFKKAEFKRSQEGNR